VLVKKAPAREVFHALRLYDGADVHADVLVPWLARGAAGLREELAPLAVHGHWRRDAYVFGDRLEQVYALSRVSDVLLLGLQPSWPADAERPWAHELHLTSGWPEITADQYLAVFAALGMTRIRSAIFDPFFHEIVAVQQDDDPDAPISITGTVWPGLMFGELLFSRAGVRVRAGALHAAAGVADRSTLHEVFLRKYRDTSDGSLGWGHNSQWKTDFRRDYLTTAGYLFNADGDADIDAWPPQRPTFLTAQERRDLLRHRCLVRHPENPAGWKDAWPGRWRLTIPRQS
jgi:hypothetical protein